MRTNLFYVIFFSILMSNNLQAKLCSLHPDNYDDSDESMELFEKNIEDRMTKIYRKEHPAILLKIKEVKETKNLLLELDHKFISPMLPSVFRDGRANPLKRILRKRVKSGFVELMKNEEITYSAVASFNDKFNLRRELVLELAQKYHNVFLKLKKQLTLLNDELDTLMAFHILKFPTVDTKIKGNDILFGNVQFEAFLRPPKDQMLSVPLIKAGFKTDATTVIYACINLDPVDSTKNQVFLYFLNTTKFYGTELSDYLSSWELGARELLTWGSRPKANINSVALEFDPIGSVLSPLTTASDQLAFLKPFEFLGTFIAKLGYSAGTASPIQSLVLDNVGFGIKAIHLNESRMKIDYGGSALFNLWQFDLFSQEIDVDLSPFLNMMTIPKHTEVQ